MTTGTSQVSVGISATGTLTPSGGSLATNTSAASAGITQSTSYGTGSGQADLFVLREKTLTAGASATYDLYTGTDLPDVFGDTAAFRKLKEVVIWVSSGGDASGVRIGGAASNPTLMNFADASDKALIFPSGLPFVAGSPAGFTVSAGAANLKVENLGAVSVTVRVWLAGTSV